VFAAAVVVVEGASEEHSLPVYARGCGHDLDALNIAVVNANGKTGIPLLLRAFEQLGMPCYAVFDGDAHRSATEAKPDINKQILRLSGATEDERPPTTVADRHAVWHEDYERHLRGAVPGYAELEERGRALLGKSKPAVARYCAEELVARGSIPPSIADIVERVVALVAPADRRELPAPAAATEGTDDILF
jgi:hypothetical protein